MDSRTPLEKLVIERLIELNMLGVETGRVITPQQAMRYIRPREFAYHHNETSGGGGGTFRVLNLRWKGPDAQLVFDVDCVEFSEFMPPTRSTDSWTARHRDRTQTERLKIRIVTD